MTAAQAKHLIEQFAAQCPFAIWVLDARGTAIFANKKLHELYDIPESPSGAIGVNLFEDPAIEALGLSEKRDRLREGKYAEAQVEVDDPSSIPSEIALGRTEPLSMRIIAYPLFSSEEAGHYVVFIEDITEANSSQHALQEQLKDVRRSLRSRDSRREHLDELRKEMNRLEEEVRELGGEPEA